MTHEFWFSKKQQDVCIELGDGHVNLFKGKLYSECFEADKGHSSNWDDAVFIGKGFYSDIRILNFNHTLDIRSEKC